MASGEIWYQARIDLGTGYLFGNNIVDGIIQT